MSHNNAKILKDGLAKGYGVIQDSLAGSLRASCMELLRRVEKNREFMGFTGQTQTSYMGALYVDGTVKALFNQRNWLSNPKRNKIPLGKLVYLFNPYEGYSRGVRGVEQIHDPSGVSLSAKFLLSYHAKKDHISIVLTTGTEYSEFIEQLLHLDVLTNTYMDAERIINSNWKKIPE